MSTAPTPKNAVMYAADVAAGEQDRHDHDDERADEGVPRVARDDDHDERDQGERAERREVATDRVGVEAGESARPRSPAMNAEMQNTSTRVTFTLSP